MTTDTTQVDHDSLGGNAVAEEIAGNKPILLDDPATAWLVQSGRLDVFGVSIENGELVGPRIHMLSAEPGQLVFGMSVGPSAELAYIAVGIAGTRVVRFTRTQLQERSQSDEGAEHVGRAVDRWVDALSGTVIRGTPPTNLSLLQPGDDTTIQADKRISPAHAAVWLSSADAIVHFLDDVEVTLDTERGPFPLSASAWVRVPERVHLAVATTESAIKDGLTWDSLEKFQQLIATRAAAHARDATALEKSRLQQIKEDELALASHMLADLATIAEGGGEAEHVAAAEEDPLVAACRLVGEQLGIEIRMPRGRPANFKRDPIGSIAQASDARARRVTLKDDWWHKDNGPLVAMTTDGRPIALLPVSPKEYEAVDPETRTRKRVNEKLAATLASGAYCFYRPFANERLTTLDMLRCALAGTRRDWLSVVGLGLLGGVLGMLVPILTGVIFGNIVPSGARSELLVVILALTVATAVTGILEFAQGISMLRIETRMDSQMESAVWDRLLKLPASFFREYTTGDLALRAMGAGRIRQILTETAISSLLSFLFSTVAFLLLFYYDRRLAWLAVGFVLLLFVVTAVAVSIQLRHERKSYRIRGKVAGLVLQLLTGISRIRVAGAENRAMAYWARNYSEQMKLSFRAQLISNVLAAFLSAVPALASFMIIAAVAGLPSDRLSLAAFLAFNAAFVQIVASAVLLSTTLTSVLEVVPLYERARPILKALPESFRGHRDPGTLNGEIELSHVNFRYSSDGPLILDDVNIQVKPGEFVALVGPSGAGKSTILRLMLGFESPTSGSIYFDREDLAGLDLQAMRRQMGVVLQNSTLMPGDILTNITGSGGYSVDEAWHAARISGLDEDLKQMPMGLYTVITEGGNTLSGGQRQRLMIARAVVSKPKILFFDEATSALDNVTQARVSKSLEELKATRVVVAHRLSTVMKADKLIVVERGRVVQQGTYDELLNQPGAFAELAKRQLI